MIAILFPKLYLVWMIKSKTAAFLESCKWAHDKFTWRDVKYVINGRSGGAGMSVCWVNKALARRFVVEQRVQVIVGVEKGKENKVPREWEEKKNN